MSPDGAWVIVGTIQHNAPSGSPVQFSRVSVKGGALQALFEAPTPAQWLFCTAVAGLCAYPTRADDDRSWLVTALDPTDGKRREWLRIPTEPGAEYRWAPSPDGSQHAILKPDWRTGQIRFISSGGQVRTVTVKGYFNLNSLDWAPDSRSVFVGTTGPRGAALLHVDLAGKAQPIWQQPLSNQTWGVPSPDGRHLALYGQSMEANVWMIDGF